MSALQPVSFKKGRTHAPRLSAPYVPGRRCERFWSEKEKAILKAHYPSGGALACKLHLPHRRREAIYSQAQALGLRFHGHGGGGPKKRTVVPDDINDRIREGWPLLKGRGAVADFADKLGVKRHWLSKRALALGLTIVHVKEPPWTAAENALMRKVPRMERLFRKAEARRHETADAFYTRATESWDQCKAAAIEAATGI